MSVEDSAWGFRASKHTLLMPQVWALMTATHATQTQPYPPSGGSSMDADVVSACFSSTVLPFNVSLLKPAPEPFGDDDCGCFDAPSSPIVLIARSLTSPYGAPPHFMLTRNRSLDESCLRRQLGSSLPRTRAIPFFSQTHHGL